MRIADIIIDAGFSIIEGVKNIGRIARSIARLPQIDHDTSENTGSITRLSSWIMQLEETNIKILESIKEIDGSLDVLIRARLLDYQAVLQTSDNITFDQISRNKKIRAEIAFLNALRKVVGVKHTALFPEERPQMEKIFGEGFDKPADQPQFEVVK